MPKFDNPFCYERRFVAFLDILGFSRLMDDPSLSEKYACNLHRIFNILLYESEDIFFLGAHIEDGEEFEFEFSRPADIRSQITSVSDAIVVSLPEHNDTSRSHPKSRLSQLLQILECIADMQSVLAAFGVLSRGGLSLGPLYHGRDMVMGQSLVSAYRLESHEALYPRVLIDEEIINILLSDPLSVKVAGIRNRIAHLISEDTDGLPFVDYFGFRPISGGLIHQEESLRVIRERITKQLLSEQSDRVKAKLEWFLSYIEGATGRYEDPNWYLIKCRQSEFRAKFPRTYENFLDILDKALANNDEYTDTFE